MSIVLAILIFGIIITIHEFGHFIAAKTNGVKVNEFAIGMGPAIFKIKKGETQYALRILPIGGYCAMEGEDKESSDGRAFCQRPVWRRIIIVVAGVFMNLILGIIILMVQTGRSEAITTTTISKFEESLSHTTGLEIGDKILSINGTEISSKEQMNEVFQSSESNTYEIVVEREGESEPVILDSVQLPMTRDENGVESAHCDFTVFDNTTTVSDFEIVPISHKTGLEVGDKIIAINGMRIFTSMDMSYKFTNDEDGVYDIVVERNGERVSLKDVKLSMTKGEDGKDILHYDFWVMPGKITVGSVITQAFKQTATDARLIYISLADIVRGKYSLKDMSGPVGIVDSLGEVIDSERDEQTGKINWASLLDTILSLSAFITINVGIFNLLPLPALDGGRLIFLIIEAIRGKPVPPEKEALVHTIGMACLFLLMIVITVSDITKIV